MPLRRPLYGFNRVKAEGCHATGGENMIAQLSIYPIGEGTSLSRFVKKGVSVIEKSGYTYEVGGMATTVETSGLDELFELIKQVHAAHVEEGARRIIIDLKVDDRRDKTASIKSKRDSVTGVK
jgi:uncharacterized protein (TIGR00106 family)